MQSKAFDYVSDMISSFPEDIGEKTALTPASNHLYKKGEGLLLCDGEKEVFHSIVAKGLYVSTRSRPDIIPTVSVISGCVRDLRTSDKEKLVQLLKYLNGTRELPLTLRYEGMSLAWWQIDSSFTCHPNFRLQSGGVLMMHPSGGGMASSSIKQKLNTRSSTMAKLVAVVDFLSKVLWVQILWRAKGSQ